MLSARLVGPEEKYGSSLLYPEAAAVAEQPAGGALDELAGVEHYPVCTFASTTLSSVRRLGQGAHAKIPARHVRSRDIRCRGPRLPSPSLKTKEGTQRSTRLLVTVAVIRRCSLCSWICSRKRSSRVWGSTLQLAPEVRILGASDRYPARSYLAVRPQYGELGGGKVLSYPSASRRAPLVGQELEAAVGLPSRTC